MPSNVHAEGLPDVNPQSTSPLSSMVNRVSNSDAFDVEMPLVDEVAPVALDSLESVDEASGLPSSSSMAPNAHAGVSDSVQPDLPPVPPPESPCPEEVHSPEVPVVPVAPSEPAGDGPVPVAPSEPAGDGPVPVAPSEPAGDGPVPVAPSEPADSEGPVPVGPRGPNIHTTPDSLLSITAPGSSIHLN